MADHLLKMLLTPQRIGHRRHFAETAGMMVTLFGADNVQTAKENPHPSQQREGLRHPKIHTYLKGWPTRPRQSSADFHNDW
jgi:hypothetical protein